MSGIPPGTYKHYSMNAPLPPKEQPPKQQLPKELLPKEQPPKEQPPEAAESLSYYERLNSILLMVMVGVDDMVKKRTLASEIKSRYLVLMNSRFNLNDTPEFIAAISTDVAALVENMLNRNGYDEDGNPWVPERL